VATQLQLNISYHITSYHIISYHIISYHIAPYPLPSRRADVHEKRPVWTQIIAVCFVQVVKCTNGNIILKSSLHSRYELLQVSIVGFVNKTPSDFFFIKSRPVKSCHSI